jgi:uncharacterized protein (TIGR03382 family)
MTLRVFVVGALLLGPSLASGEGLPVYGPGDISPELGFVGAAREDGLVLARQVLPQSTSTIPTVSHDRNIALAQSRVVYLNRTGVTLLPGNNDARTNRSTIVSQQTAIQGWNVSATVWNETVACMRDLFAPFDVQIVTTDPGNVPHIEAVFGGTPQQVGMAANVAGVSPFTLDCSVIENSIVFTFTNAFTFSSREACEIMAQEVAHSYGLDHQLLASDPMTYLNYTGNRTFKDQTVSCGESAARPCGINGSVCRPNQNSVALLRERLGVADVIAPTIAFQSPANNAVVPPGFQVRVTGSDNNVVTGAVLKIDGIQVDSINGAGPFTFTTPSTLREGPHTIEVEISDGKNAKGETRNVTVQAGAPPPSDDEDTSGGGGNGGTGNGDEVDPYGELSGGCNAGGSGSGALFALGLLVALAIRRRS